MQDNKVEEIPEEFLDCLTNSLMKNPFILPHMDSAYNIDKTTLYKIKEENANIFAEIKYIHPYNQKKYTYEDFVENIELKKQIEKWKGLHKDLVG